MDETRKIPHTSAMPAKFYLTTTLPYVNAIPHMGHALEFVQADILARAHRAKGDDVFFNTGTDEHGQKIYQRAQEEGMDAQAYTDKYADIFKKTLSKESGLNIAYDTFIRTTDAHHKAAAQEFWKRCDAAGDIYLKTYQAKYCVGCELNKTDSELEDGRCPLHPNKEIELIDEENYFFRFSKYQQKLLDLYAAQPDFVVPQSRLNEIRSFVESGLEDFSISRLKEKMPWGVPVPGDANQVMYVWFDALVNYISTLGWPEDTERTNTFWPTAVQIAGKDNLRQQSAMWQAMLMSASIPTSRHILIHGFILSDGKKMSKTIGNVIDPMEIRAQFGTDALRYFLARELPTFEDGDFTMERFKEAYTSGLVNGLGNLVSRTLKMATSYGVAFSAAAHHAERRAAYDAALNAFQLKAAADVVWQAIADANSFIEHTEPFKTFKTDPERAKTDVATLLGDLGEIAELVAPFLPETAEKITAALNTPNADEIPKLFPRL